MSKDIVEIREELNLLRRVNNRSHYNYCIGPFSIKIYTSRIQEQPIPTDQDNIMNHEVVDVYVFESRRTNDPHFTEHIAIHLEKDARFKHYTPIKYSEWADYSTGVEMPISHLCELIKYLHRLSKLSIFG